MPSHAVATVAAKKSMNEALTTPPIYPEDAQDEPSPTLFADEHEADVFRQLLIICLPPQTSREGQRYLDGCNRMIALAWVLAPEQFNGGNCDQVAARLGIGPTVFKNQVHEVRDILAQKPGPFWGVCPDEVPKEA